MLLVGRCKGKIVKNRFVSANRTELNEDVEFRFTNSAHERAREISGEVLIREKEKRKAVKRKQEESSM